MQKCWVSTRHKLIPVQLSPFFLAGLLGNGDFHWLGASREISIRDTGATMGATRADLGLTLVTEGIEHSILNFGPST
jgi:hypothetical protein